MEDLSKKITELLGNPETMQQIQGLAGMLGQSEKNTETTAPKPEEQTENPMDMLNPEMLSTMMKIAPMLQSAKADNDSVRLLRALKPFMHEERSKKIDSAIRLLGLLKALPMLKNSGIHFFS